MKTPKSKLSIAQLLLGLCLFASITWNAHAQNTIQLSKGTLHQPIWGFGASANHPVQDLMTNPTLSAANRTLILDTLFRTDGNNVGLSIIRLEVNPFRRTDFDPNNREQFTVEPSDGVWDWDTDHHQRSFSDAALARASDIGFLATPWSPPAWMKSNGSAINGGSLLAANYDKFALYLKTWVDHYRTVYGYDIRWVSMQNEPTNSTPYASCTYTNSALDTVAGKVADAIHSLNQGVLVGAPEGATRGISNTFMSAMSAATKAKLDFILTHDYTGANTSLGGYGKLVWNTEVWSESGTDDTSITDGIRWATAIKSAVVDRSEPGWLYWWIVDYTDGSSAAALMNLKTNGTFVLPKRLYALGQFSRFMRKGSTRVGSTSSNAQLLVTAATDAAGHAAVVVINNGTGALTATVSGLTYSAFDVYRTSATENLAHLADIGIASGSASVTFAAKSITTLVEKGTVGGGGGTAVTAECETMPLVASSADTNNTVADPLTSAGNWRKYSSNAVNDFITLSQTVTAGTYTIKVKTKGLNDRGIMQLATAESSGGPFTNKDAPKDCYTAGTTGTYNTLTYTATVTFATTGTKYFRFTVTGKNAGSTNYILPLDAVILTPQ